jgi:hypothetical protein
MSGHLWATSLISIWTRSLLVLLTYSRLLVSDTGSVKEIGSRHFLPRTRVLDSALIKISWYGAASGQDSDMVLPHRDRSRSETHGIVLVMDATACELCGRNLARLDACPCKAGGQAK